MFTWTATEKTFRYKPDVRLCWGDVLTAALWMLSTEGQVVVPPRPNFLAGMAVFFSSYYNLSPVYQEPASRTLDFIQRFCNFWIASTKRQSRPFSSQGHAALKWSLWHKYKTNLQQVSNPNPFTVIFEFKEHTTSSVCPIWFKLRFVTSHYCTIK